MKIKKIILYFIIVFSLLIGCVLIAPQLFKKQIEQAVSGATEQYISTAVHFNDLEISFFKNFPNLSVSLNQLSIEAPQSFNGLKTVETNSIDLGIDIFSLFSDQIKFTKLYVNKGNFNIVTDSLGNFSFTIFKSSPEPSTNSSFSLALNKIHIKNSNVLYQDDVSKIQIKTNNTNINNLFFLIIIFFNFNINIPTIMRNDNIKVF